VAAPYTRRLAAELLELADWSVLYVHNTASTVILRDIVVCWDNPGELANFKLGVQPVTKTGFVELLATPLTANQTIHLDLRQELLVNEEVLAYSSAPAGPYVWITAYVFEA